MPTQKHAISVERNVCKPDDALLVFPVPFSHCIFQKMFKYMDWVIKEDLISCVACEATKAREGSDDTPLYIQVDPTKLASITYGNFDIVLDHHSRVSQRYAAPCGRGRCRTWCLCLSDADWRLQSDVVPDSRPQLHEHTADP